MTSRVFLGMAVAAAIATAGATAFAAAPAQQPLGPPRPLAPPQQNVPPPAAQPYAQPPGAQPYAQPAPGDPRLSYRAAYMEDYFTFLRNTLRITQVQMPAWNRFEDTVRQNMQDRVAQRPVPRDPRAGPMPLPDRLAQQRARLDAQRARLDAIDAALRPLYASFTEEQRRIADVELSPARIAAPLRANFRDRFRPRGPFGRRL
jgi:hypothetical protein